MPIASTQGMSIKTQLLTACLMPVKEYSARHSGEAINSYCFWILIPRQINLATPQVQSRVADTAVVLALYIGITFVC